MAISRDSWLAAFSLRVFQTLHTPLHVSADCAGPKQAGHSNIACVGRMTWAPCKGHSGMHAMNSMESYGAAGTLHRPGLGSLDLPWLACSGVVHGQKCGDRVVPARSHW